MRSSGSTNGRVVAGSLVGVLLAAVLGVLTATPVQGSGSITLTDVGGWSRPGGTFFAQGDRCWVPASGIPAGHWENVHPLRCGVAHEAVVQDAVDGEVCSGVSLTPCPVVR